MWGGPRPLGTPGAREDTTRSVGVVWTPAETPGVEPSSVPHPPSAPSCFGPFCRHLTRRPWRRHHHQRSARQRGLKAHTRLIAHHGFQHLPLWLPPLKPTQVLRGAQPQARPSDHTCRQGGGTPGPGFFTKISLLAYFLILQGWFWISSHLSELHFPSRTRTKKKDLKGFSPFLG